MKNKFFLLFATALLFSIGCDKNLDLDPHQSINEGVALSSDKLVKLALLGAYDKLSQEGVYGGNLVRDAELSGADGEVNWVGTFGDPREIYNHVMLTTNFDVENTWAQAYSAINAANNVLSALSVVNEDDRARVEGEAKFIRGVCYFELARLYGNPDRSKNSGRGVPVVTTATRGVDESSFVSRSSLDDVFKQAHDDLHAALDQLPDDNGVFANRFTAAAMLARMHLYLGEWADAEEHAGIVIDGGKYSLEPNYADIWNRDDDSGETIFAMQVNDQDGDNELVTFFSIPDYGGRDGDIEINQKHLDLYDPSDARLALFFDGNGAMRTGKWQQQYKNIPILRLAEMHLIRAEAVVRGGGNADDDYNAVHTRAGLPSKTGVSLDDVLLERRLELAFEGHRLHDVRRLQGSVDGLSWNDNKLVFPIPGREMSVNKNLAQNDGY